MPDARQELKSVSALLSLTMLFGIAPAKAHNEVKVRSPYTADVEGSIMYGHYRTVGDPGTVRCRVVVLTREYEIIGRKSYRSRVGDRVEWRVEFEGEPRGFGIRHCHYV